MRSAIAIVSALAILASVTFSIASKERLLASGRLVYLELAPVDPRSLMQGDYMALEYSIADDARSTIVRVKPSATDEEEPSDDLPTANGHIVAAVNGDAVATYQRLDDHTALAANEILLRYRVRDGRVQFATNAYFFEEGTAERYEQARYGAFRVAPDGELLLTGLRDKDRQPL